MAIESQRLDRKVATRMRTMHERVVQPITGVGVIRVQFQSTHPQRHRLVPFAGLSDARCPVALAFCVGGFLTGSATTG